LIIGTCRLELALPKNGTLKGKRRVVKSIIDRVRKRYNVAVAEVDCQDRHDLVVLGIACVTNEQRHASQLLAAVVSWIDRNAEGYLIDYYTEVLH